jgi:hypothetical protein
MEIENPLYSSGSSAVKKASVSKKQTEKGQTAQSVY